MRDTRFTDYLIDDFLPVAIMAVLAIAIAAWLIRILIFFMVRLLKWREPNPHESKETMGLPKGAVRTFLALSFTSLTTLAILGENVIDDVDKKWLLGELGIIIAFYFGSKAVESYVDSRVKLATIEKAEKFSEAVSVSGPPPNLSPSSGKRPVPPAPEIPES